MLRVLALVRDDRADERRKPVIQLVASDFVPAAKVEVTLEAAQVVVALHDPAKPLPRVINVAELPVLTGRFPIRLVPTF